MPERNIKIEQDDLSSYLETLAERLRTDVLALEGYAALHAPMGSGQGDPDLEALSDSLRRTAIRISGIGDGLCRACRMLHVAEGLTVEIPGKPETATERKGSRRKI